MGRIADISDVLLELGLTDSATDSERAVVQAAIRRAESDVSAFLRYDPAQTTRTEYYPVFNVNHSAVGVWEANDNNAYIRNFNEAISNQLQLKHLPIRTSTAIALYIDYDGRFGKKSGGFTDQKTEGQDFWADYEGVDDDGYSICRNGILRSIGLWPVEPGSVKVVYKSGYSAAEFRGEKTLVDATPIWSAVVDEAVRRSQKVFVSKKSSSVGWLAGPITSENLGDYSYNIEASIASKLFGSQVGLTTDSKEKLQPFVNWGLMF